MPTITPGNALYLYLLLSRDIGVGRQTPLARVSQVLDDDDIQPSDLRCSDVRNLLENLEFIRLTVFKRGRVYATVIAQPEWDARAEEAGKESSPQKGGHKSWKRKRNNKTLRPERPRPHGRPQPSTAKEAPKKRDDSKPQEIAKAARPPETSAVPKREAAQPEVAAIPEPATQSKTAEQPEAVAQTESTMIPESVAQPEPAQPEPPVAPEAVVQLEAAEQPEPATKPAPIAHPQPAAPTKAAGAIPGSAAHSQGAATNVTPIHARPQERQSHEASMAYASSAAAIPHDFAREVWCPSNVLSSLYQLLPLDINPIELLAEDWRYACSTEEYDLSASDVVFSLRCLRAPSSIPVRAHLHRQAPTASGRRWQLATIDGPINASTIDFNGLPAADEGAWSDLVGLPHGAYYHTSPLRELTQFADLGPWQPLLAQLAALAQPEPWGMEFIGLREYLAVTFHRLMHEHKLASSHDESLATFDTGLLTANAQRIFANFVAHDTVVPWRLSGFSTDPCVSPAPEPAEYIADVRHLMLTAPYTVRTSKAFLRNAGLSHVSTASLDTAIERSVKQARRSHRAATPAYDPQAEELRLLLPLALEVPHMVDQALVLAPLDEGGYEARAVISLERARTCARVITAELPSWLAPIT